MRALPPLLLALVACSSPAPAPSPAPTPVADASPAPEPASAAPVASAEQVGTSKVIEPSAPNAGRKRAPRLVQAPANGCVLHADQTLAVAEHGVAFFLDQRASVLAFGDGPAAMSLWSEDDAGVFIKASDSPLEARGEHASVSCTRGRCHAAWVDQRARLLARAITESKLEPARLLATGIDRRFAPAVASDGERVHYAYTRSVDEAMHTLWIAQTGEQSSAPRDLTPAGHGAAAASFVLGATRPTLVFIDAHAGISPFIELVFDRDGKPGEAVVRTPISQPYAPPLLSAVQWSDGKVEVVYSAVGRAAMTAIARVPLQKAVDPTALLPSSGYGPLAFSAARSHRRALFALELPSAPAPGSARALVLKLLDGTRTDDGPRLAPGVRRPSLASGARAGEYLLSYVRDKQLHAVRVSCAD